MNNHPRQSAALTLTLALVLAAAGCDQRAAEAKTERVPAPRDSAGVAASESTEAPSQTAETQDPAPGLAVLARYESIRAALARDAVASTTADAAALESSARSAAAAAAGDMAAQWRSVADAAKRLHEMPKDDADGVRKAFGDLSQQLILVLRADPALAKGLHVFECPMAQGYKKWVQPAAKLSNPYMGTRMPECGSKSSL